MHGADITDAYNAKAYFVHFSPLLFSAAVSQKIKNGGDGDKVNL